MPSPFPGMDPYLEESWGDVHTSLVTYLRDALQEVLPAPLCARAETRVAIEADEDDRRWVYPDVRVTESPEAPASLSSTLAAAAAVADPVLVEVEDEAPTERYVEILDPSDGRRVVTAIEILSPANKTPGDGLKGYRSKQRSVVESATNLVEIDLLRAGRHVLAVPLRRLKRTQRTPYMICVRRAASRGIAEVYSISLRSPLPTIRIPLRESDADVRVDLQALVARAYRMGGYDGRVTYARPLDPPLTGRDAAWADALLKEKGLRPT